MSSPAVGYWVADNLGRVLGPLALQALRELIASGRLKAAVRASRDGTQWVGLQELPELADLFAAARPGPSVEQQQAERLRTQLRGLLNLGPHEVFGVKPAASLDEVRLAFFRMAKRFSPQHLAPDTHPELRKVSEEIFEFLSRRMREAEAFYAQGVQPQRPAPPRLDLHGAPAVPVVAPVAPVAAMPPRPAPPVMAPVAAMPARPPPVMHAVAQAPAAPPPPRPPPVVQAAPAVARAPAPRPMPPPPAPAPAPAPIRRAVAAPTYSSAEFVGLERRSDDRIHADVKVSMQNAGIFTDHRIINLSSGGLFISADRPLRLGTQVELTLRFDDPPRVMTLRSSVIWENTLEDGKNPRGYGLRLSSLRKEEREFIEQFVNRARALKKKP